MNADESFESLVDAERQQRLCRVEAERGWKRLQAAVRSGARPTPVVAAPLSLGAVLFTARAAAVFALAGASTALAAGTWAYRVELGIVSVSGAPDTPANAPTQTRHPVHEAGRHPARDALDERRPAPRRAESVPSPPPSFTGSRAPSPRSLDAELDLLGRATAELDAGRPTAALALLQRHAAQYPRSMLALERETLRILVECRVRPGPSSTTLAHQFLARHPKSLHRDRLQRGCSLNAEHPDPPNAKAKPAPSVQPTGKDPATSPARALPPSAAFPDPKDP